MTRRHRNVGVALVLIAAGSAHAACAQTAEPLVASIDSPTRARADAGADAAVLALPPERVLCELEGPPKLSSDDVLVFADEFDGSTLDTNKWNVFDGAENHNGMLGTFAATNVQVQDGELRVLTTAGSTDPAYAYTTGRIDTAHRFARTYGRMDVRARFPIAPGVWYAVWARQWHTPFPELDIEVLGKAIPEVWMVNHWAGGDLPPEQRRKAAKVPNVDPTVFHVYSVDWKPGVIEWSIDGNVVMTSDERGVPASPIEWTINSWVGGWGGPVTANTPLPTSFDVDYLRVYRAGGVIADPAIRVTRFDRHGGAPYNVPPYSKRSDDLELDVANFDEACFHVEMREGDKLLDALDKPPFRFPLAAIPVGPHVFTFVATDGVRSVTVDAATYVE